jgi:hypothetical protein
MRPYQLMIIFLLVVAFTGCRQSAQQADSTSAESTITIDLVVEPDPPAMGDTTLIVTLTDADGDPIDDATIEAVGDMDHAGMQPVNGEIEDGTDGEYRIPFEWTMGGDWTVTLTVTLADGATVEQTFDLAVESSMG